jgi:hypothetical protein
VLTRTTYLTLLLTFILLVSTTMAQTSATPVTPAVTTELAAEHLFARLADGPTAPLWSARTQALREGGFTAEQIRLIVQTANMLAAGNEPLAKQAGDIHKRLKSKSLDRASGVLQLKDLDNQRSAQFDITFDRLKGQLGFEGWYKLETFLNDVVKPTVLVGN